jgi:hypothetical protein
VDTLFSLCDKEITIDFLEINKKINSFSKNFNSKIYIENNEDLFLLSPERWINEYQQIIDTFIKTCVEDAQKILIDKKYIFYIINNNKRFYALYKKHYDETFNELDKILYLEQNAINIFVAQKIKEYNNQEIH